MIVKIESVNINTVGELDRAVESSLSIKKTNDKKRSMSISLYYASNETLPSEGQDIQIYDDTTLIFGGVIKTIAYTPISPSIVAGTYIEVKISSSGYNSIPARRTVNNIYVNTTSGDVVTELITTILTDEGITAGTISDGATINSYMTDVKALDDILDELADASGFLWNINDDKSLDFMAPTTLSTSTLSVVEGDRGHFDLKPTKTLNNYRNKQYVVGGESDDPIIVSSSDATEIASRATIEGNSGVYGNVYRDSNIQDETDAQAVADEMLNRYKNLINVKFKSYTQYELGKVMTINYAVKYGINTSFLVTTETIKRKDHSFIYQYDCEARDVTNYSSKQKDNAIDFFKKLAEGGYGGGSGGGIPAYYVPAIPADLSDYNVGDILLVASS